MKTTTYLKGTALVAAAAALTFGVVAGPAAATDFAGKRIEWIIPFGTGGGSDAWARFYAPRLQKHLPGEPVVAIMNMAGASSTKGTNYFARRASNDGLMILGTSGSTQFPYLLDDRRVEYDYNEWEAVLATPVGGVAYVSAELGVKSASPEDMKKLQQVEMKFGSQGATSLDLVPLLAFDILGLKVDGVFGMQGRGPARLAFERGEVKIDYQTTPAYIKNVVPLVEAGKAVPLMSWGMLDDDGNLVRDPAFPDLPHVGEVYKAMHGTDPTGPAWDAWRAFMAAGYPAQKMIFVRKDTPQEIKDVWHKAAADTVNEPGFQEAAAKALGDYPQAVGRKALVLQKVATEVTPEAKAWVKDWLKRRFNAVP